MTSDPNRSTWLSALPPPTLEDWLALIEPHGSQRAFAAAHGLHEKRVSEWLAGMPCHWALYELILLRENKHPHYRVTRVVIPMPRKGPAR